MLSSAFIKQAALETGFDACGIAKAVPVTPEEWPYDTMIERGYHAGMDYMARHRDLRFDPALLHPGTQSVISVLLGYRPDARVPHIAQYAYGEDYHTRIKRMLYALVERLRKEYPGFAARPFVDTAPIPDKVWAVRAGLGWIGRNTLLINPEHGSYCNIGELLTDAVVDHYDTPVPNGCPTDCRRCVDACPNQALVPLGNTQNGCLYSHILDARRCTAYNTIENRDETLPDDLDTAGYAFGCDCCQLACPYNHATPVRYHLTPERRSELESLGQLAASLSDGNTTPHSGREQEPQFEKQKSNFKKATRHTAMSRITYPQWLRNMRKLLPLAVILSLQLTIPLRGQSYQARFETAIEQADTTLQRRILDEWREAVQDDVEYYIALYNFHLHRPTSEKSAMRNDSALIALNQAIEHYPNRLDLRFGKAYYLSSINHWDAFTDELVGTVDHSRAIAHRWDYPNMGEGLPSDTGEQLVADGLLDFLTDLHALATSPAIDTAMVLRLRKASLRMAQVFPSNVPALNFLAVSYSLLNDYEHALKYLLRAQRIDPDDEIIRNNITELQHIQEQNNK